MNNHVSREVVGTCCSATVVKVDDTPKLFLAFICEYSVRLRNHITCNNEADRQVGDWTENITLVLRLSFRENVVVSSKCAGTKLKKQLLKWLSQYLSLPMPGSTCSELGHALVSHILNTTWASHRPQCS